MKRDSDFEKSFAELQARIKTRPAGSMIHTKRAIHNILACDMAKQIREHGIYLDK